MLSDSYKRLQNRLKLALGLPLPHPEVAPAGAAKPPLASEVVDADDDGLELKDVDEATELLRKTIADINGQGEDAGDAGDDDGEKDEYSALGALARPTRHLLMAHFKAKLEGADLEQQRAAIEAELVQDAVAFFKRHASAGVIKK
jgi:hypothetical protein